MKRSLIVAFSLALLIASAKADSIMLFFGIGSSGGTPVAACGTGVIDLSAGCTLPIALRLVP